MKSLWTVALVILILGSLLGAGRWLHSKTRHNAPRQTSATPPRGLIAAEATVSQGAELFPVILPGNSCETVRTLLGKESKSDQYSIVWKREDMEISVFRDSDCIVQSVLYFVEPGHTLVTPDGVILGKDTVSDAVQRVKSRIADSSPFISEGEGHVAAELELPPTPTFQFKTIYSWHLDDSTTNKLGHDPLVSDFTGESVDSYSLDTIPVHKNGEVPYD